MIQSCHQLINQAWELGKKCDSNFVLTFQRSGTTALQQQKVVFGSVSTVK